MRPLEHIREGLPTGRHWYPDAHLAVTRLAGEHAVAFHRACDVLAITSPRVSVKRNVTLTRQYLDSGDTEGMLPATTAALAHWERTGIIRGPKTRAFAQAIGGDTKAVVVDVWVLRAFGEDPKKGATVGTHRRIARVMRGLATRLGETPRECQAALWVSIRREHNRSSDALLSGLL